MLVYVDGGLRRIVRVFTNERNSHKSFVSGYQAISGLPAGTHTIRLEELYEQGCNTAGETRLHACTDTDRNDVFEVGFVEIPD